MMRPRRRDTAPTPDAPTPTDSPARPRRAAPPVAGSRIDERREVRTNLRAAASDIGTREALARLGTAGNSPPNISPPSSATGPDRLLTDTQSAHDGVSHHADVAFHVMRVLAP